MKNIQPFLNSRISPRFLLLLIFLLGLGLRLYKLDFQSFWLDEYYNIAVASQIKSLFHGFNGLPPAYIFLLKEWLAFFPLSEITARLPSAIIGSLSVLLFYQLGKELFNTRIALWASFFLAISTIHIDCSQEAKQYPLMFVMVMLMQLEFVRILKYNRPVNYILYGLFSTIGFYTHFFLLTLFLLHNLFLIFHRRINRSMISKIFLVQFIAICCLAPRLVLALRDPGWITGNLAWIPHPTLAIITGTTTSLFSARFGLPPYSLIGRDSHILEVCFGVLIALLIIFILRNLPKTRGSCDVLGLIIFWSILPSIIFLGWSFLFFNIYQFRYLLDTVLALYLLYGWLMDTEKSKIFRVFFVSVIIFINTTNLIFYFNHPVRHQFRETAAVIRQTGKTNDRILVQGYQYEQVLFKYYLEKLGGQNLVEFRTKSDTFTPYDYDWIVAVNANKIDTAQYHFAVKYFYGIALYQKI